MVERRLEVLPDADAVARRGATMVLEAAAATATGFALAVSGGRTPVRMFERLGGLDWERTAIWQVDERVAPEGHRDRNLTGLLAALPTEAHDRVRPMPVTEPDLEAAAERYAAGLPPAFDLIHLGLGDDGHTASLVPRDPVLGVHERDVAVTGDYRGRRRMTLTYRALERASLVLWLVTGADKAEMVQRLLSGDRSIPAGRVQAPTQLVVVDEAAAAR